VRRSNNSIHRAASETPKSPPDAIFRRVSSFEPLISSGLREKELVLLDMKSDNTQKNVTV
jgi:hypothetical protein